jgi:hypothetical protein
LSRPSCPYLFDGSRRHITPRYGCGFIRRPMIL